MSGITFDHPTEPRQRLRALTQDLVQQLTVISLYADACEQMIRARTDVDPQSIITWTTRITEQVHLGHATIEQLQELAGHGD